MRISHFATIAVGLLTLIFSLSCAPASAVADESKGPPAVGEMAADFSLPNLRGEKIGLKELVADGPVVLVVLRGYPGYQCPICTRQVGDLLAHADEFSKSGAKVVMVYPGSAKQLDEHAKEFIGGKMFPKNFRFLIDPDYKFTNAYHLRWNASQETAYPSSFVIDRHSEITFADVSQTHGSRTSAIRLLQAIKMDE